MTELWRRIKHRAETCVVRENDTGTVHTPCRRAGAGRVDKRPCGEVEGGERG